MSERSLEDELLHPSKVHAYVPPNVLKRIAGYVPMSIEQILDAPFPPRPDQSRSPLNGFIFEQYWARLDIREIHFQAAEHSFEAPE